MLQKHNAKQIMRPNQRPKGSGHLHINHQSGEKCDLCGFNTDMAVGVRKAGLSTLDTPAKLLPSR